MTNTQHAIIDFSVPYEIHSTGNRWETSSAVHNGNGHHIGERDYWFSVTALLPRSLGSTLLANQNSTCHENIR